MSNIELVKFEEFPHDPYTKAIAVLSVDGKYNVCYGKKVMKDGGTYWASPSFGCKGGGDSKEYFEGFAMDSKKEDQKFKDFLKQSEDKLRGKQIDVRRSDLPFIERQAEVVQNEGLPF